MDDIKILKGNIIYTKTKDEFEICEHGYLVCKDGQVEGISDLEGNQLRIMEIV